MNAIYFLSKGSAGFSIPYKNRNIIYCELLQGDDFGQVDIFYSAFDRKITPEELILSKESIIRSFSALTTKDCEIFTFDFDCLKKMIIEFKIAFEGLFRNGELRLRRLTKLRFRAF